MRFDNYRASDMSETNTVPDGTYHLRIAKAQYRTPKNATEVRTDDRGIPVFQDEKGKEKWPYLLLDFIVMDEGEQLGRHVFDNYVTLEPGEDWKLRQIVKAIELPDDWVFDSDELIDGELYGVVTTQKAGKGPDGNWYNASNRIGRYIGMNVPAEQLAGTGRTA